MLDRITPLLASAALTLSLLVGCVDNSGGEPPAGEPLEFAVAMDDPSLLCDSFEDAASLIRSEQDVDDFVAACGEGAGDITAVAEDLDAALADLQDGQALVLIRAELGGCITGFDIAAVHLDGPVLRPWMLKGDSAWGRSSVACPASIGQAHRVLVVDDAADAETVELSVGVYNPELPGGPELPVEAS